MVRSFAIVTLAVASALAQPSFAQSGGVPGHLVEAAGEVKSAIGEIKNPIADLRRELAALRRELAKEDRVVELQFTKEAGVQCTTSDLRACAAYLAERVAVYCRGLGFSGGRAKQVSWDRTTNKTVIVESATCDAP